MIKTLKNLEHLSPVEKEIIQEIDTCINRNPDKTVITISHYSERIARELRMRGWFAILTTDNKMEMQKAF